MYKTKKQGSNLQGRSTTNVSLDKRLLLIHNTLPEYRLEWFNEIDRLIPTTFWITQQEIAYKNYKFDVDKEFVSSHDCFFFKEGKKAYKELKEKKKEIKNYSFVILPPCDSLKEMFMSWSVIRTCKKEKINLGYFGEGWEAPKNKQPLKRRIKNYLKRLAANTVIHKCDLIFASGSKSKEWFMSQGILENKITILPDCSVAVDCEHEDIRTKYNIPKDKYLVLYFGRLMKEKGLDVLIEAFDKLENKESYYLLIAGGPYKDETFKDYCKNLVLEKKLENVQFIGAINPKFKKNFFGQSDIFVFPGTFMGGWVDVWGLTNNEAIQFGVPIVSTTAVGSAYDLIKDGINGYQVEAENVEELSKAISKAIKLKDSAKEYDEELIKKYCPKNMAKILVDSIGIK